MQATTDWSKSVRVEVRADDVVGNAGNVIPRMLADHLGLTSGLSAALSRLLDSVRWHPAIPPSGPRRGDYYREGA